MYCYFIFLLIFQVTNLVEGEFQDLIKLFSNMLNFTVVQQLNRFDGGWGQLDKDTGQWDGMISNIINGEADLAIATLTICCGRTEVVDYLWTLAQPRPAFAIKG